MDPTEFNDSELEAEMNQQLAGLTPEDLTRMTTPPPAAEPDGHGRVHGRIIGVRGPEVFVDLGGKSEAFLPIDEFPEDQPPEAGQTLAFMMQGRDHDTGMMRLSLREARSDARLDTLKIGDVVDARVTGVNIGGLELTAGSLRCFMPKSQVELARVEDFGHYVGRRLDCEITEIDRKGKNLIVSHRKVLQRRRDEQREEVEASLEVGQRRKGIVQRLTDFGAFVDIGGVDGLLHVSDMSWSRVSHPKELVKQGQELEVEVLKIDKARGRISLGLKQLAPDPWELVEANFRPGATVDGRVVKLMNFGAFVELQPGVEGLIPISEMSWTQRVRHPKDILSEGSSVRVSILAADIPKRKISLSLRALADNPWDAVEAKYSVGAKCDGTVKRLTDFGAFVELEEGIEGLVHVSEMSDKHVRAASDVCKEGDTVKVRVKAIDTRERRISLSMKVQVDSGHASDDDIAAFSSGAQSEPPKKKRKRPLKGGLD